MELMTVSQVAEALQVSRQQVQTWFVRRASNGFPDVDLWDSRGKLWAKERVVKWHRSYRPARGGRPRKSRG